MSLEMVVGVGKRGVRQKLALCERVGGKWALSAVTESATSEVSRDEACDRTPCCVPLLIDVFRERSKQLLRVSLDGHRAWNSY